MKQKLLAFFRHETVKYIIAGGCTTLFNLVVFTILSQWLSVEVNLSNFFSVVLSILFAYGINKLYVFESHCENGKELALEFAKFVGARLLTMVIEVGGVFVLYSLLHVHELVSKVATQVIVLIANYVISKLLVFKNQTR
ncbi:MAG: GtrA family protein [Clostridia bacterium]|nr:GtrA family protein [Clostridia bacterium]